MTNAQIIEQSRNPVHKNNRFVHDVAQKLQRFGQISARQMDTLVAAMNADIARAKEQKEEAKTCGEAPDGKATVVGTVICKKLKDSGFGERWKMMVELENRAKVWCSIPREVEGEILHCKVSVTAKWVRSPDDKSFAFGAKGTRPKMEILARPVPVEQVITAPKEDEKGLPEDSNAEKSRASKAISTLLASVGQPGSVKYVRLTNRLFSLINGGSPLTAALKDLEEMVAKGDVSDSAVEIEAKVDDDPLMAAVASMISKGMA